MWFLLWNDIRTYDSRRKFINSPIHPAEAIKRVRGTTATTKHHDQFPTGSSTFIHICSKCSHQLPHTHTYTQVRKLAYSIYKSVCCGYYLQIEHGGLNASFHLPTPYFDFVYGCLWVRQKIEQHWLHLMAMNKHSISDRARLHMVEFIWPSFYQ